MLDNNSISNVNLIDSGCKWQPIIEQIEQSQIAKFVLFINKNLQNISSNILNNINHSKQNNSHNKLQLNSITYDTLYQWSIAEPTLFWSLFWQFSGIVASQKWDEVLVNPNDMLNAKWFVGSKLNYAANLLKYRNDDLAIVFRNELNTELKFTHNELYNAVAKLAKAMRSYGITTNDRVVGLMPNLPHTVIAMLAATSIGAAWSSCSPDYGVQGVVDRFGQIEPKLLFTIDGYTYNNKIFDCRDKVQQIIKALPSMEAVVIFDYMRLNADVNINNINHDPNIDSPNSPQIFSWDGFCNIQINHTDTESAESLNIIEFAQVDFDHPLFIMYSSGTTGIPKCIVHGVGGTLIQHLKEHMLHTNIIYGTRVFYYTTCGWMMWNWLVSSLASGATLMLYDGAPMTSSTPGVLWDYATTYKINIFGTSAKYLSALEKSGYSPKDKAQKMKQHDKQLIKNQGDNSSDLSSLRVILSTGSPLLPENYDYVYSNIKTDVQLCSISGGTDIISCFALGNPTLPVYRGELQQIGFGLNVRILDEAGRELPIGEKGELSCISPFPSQPIYFWNDPDKTKYRGAYFAKIPNVWCHGDFAAITIHGGLIIYGRSDTTLNPGGVRIGTAEIYRQVELIKEVQDAVAVGQIVNGDEQIILFVKLQPNLNHSLTLDDILQNKIKQQIKIGASPHHVPARIIAVQDIPRTITGKIAELAVKNMIHGEVVKNKDALANPESLKYFTELI